MAVNGIISGLESDFKLSMPRQRQSATLSGPQSGDYDGYFFMKVDGVKKILERGVHLEFTQDGSIYRVKGQGCNNIGSYTMEGTYNPETMDMACSRQYVFALYYGMQIRAESIRPFHAAAITRRIRGFGSRTRVSRPSAPSHAFVSSRERGFAARLERGYEDVL